MKKQYRGSVIAVKDDNIVNNIPFVTGKEAEEWFLQSCKDYIAHFEEYTSKDIAEILDKGYEYFGTGFVAIHWF